MQLSPNASMPQTALTGRYAGNNVQRKRLPHKWQHLLSGTCSRAVGMPQASHAAGGEAFLRSAQ